jgi:hypothetical protein
MDDGHDGAPHAPSSVDLRAIAAAVGIIAGGIALAVAVPWAILARSPAPANAPNNAKRPPIAPPVLQTAPSLDLQSFRREKRAAPEAPK